MLHNMKLKLSPFEKIKNGSKTIELRLNGEKRQKVQVGDFIEFSCLDNPESKIQTRVTAQNDNWWQRLCDERGFCYQ